MQGITPFLMFEGRAEEAMNFYVSLFEDAEIVSMKKFGAAGPGPEGTVMHATFKLQGQEFMCIDSFVKHGFGFTPAISLYVTCKTAEEVKRICSALSDGGGVMMPVGEYPFNKRYGWVSDRFGVSWQVGMAM